MSLESYRNVQVLEWDCVKERLSYLRAFDHASNIVGSFKNGEVVCHQNTMCVKQTPVVYQMWYQGMDARPDIVTHCMDSVDRNLSLERVLLTRENLEHYVAIPGYIYDLAKFGKMRLCHFSDIVRSSLLASQGGLWLDSTIYLSGSVNFFHTTRMDFFAYQYPPSDVAGNPLRSIETWMLWTSKPSHLFKVVYTCLLDYWRKNESISHYFLFNHYITAIKNLLRINFGLRPIHFNIDPHLMLLNWNSNFTNEVFDYITSRSKVHKLTYTLPRNDFYKRIANCG
jgi:hypothetical protein